MTDDWINEWHDWRSACEVHDEDAEPQEPTDEDDQEKS